MGQLWIEGTDDSGSSYSIRWTCTDEQADKIDAFIVDLLGTPDTVT